MATLAPVILGGKFTSGTGAASAAAAEIEVIVLVVPDVGLKIMNAVVVTTSALPSTPKPTPSGALPSEKVCCA